MCTYMQGGMEDVGHHTGAVAYQMAPLLIPNLAAMGVAFFRGWVADPVSLADGPEAWKDFLTARKPSYSPARHFLVDLLEPEMKLLYRTPTGEPCD